MLNQRKRKRRKRKLTESYHQLLPMGSKTNLKIKIKYNLKKKEPRILEDLSRI